MRCALLAACVLAWPSNSARAKTARDEFVAFVTSVPSGSLDDSSRVDAERNAVTGQRTADIVETDATASTTTGESSRKSPSTALAWALGSTFAGWGLAAGGIAGGNAGLFIFGEAVSAFGPSAGHFYAGEYGHGFATSLIRGGALFAADVILVLAFEEDLNGGDSGEGLFFTSVAVAAGLGLYDWIDAPRAATRANRASGFELGLAPMATERGRPTVALTVARKF